MVSILFRTGHDLSYGKIAWILHSCARACAHYCSAARALVRPLVEWASVAGKHLFRWPKRKQGRSPKQKPARPLLHCVMPGCLATTRKLSYRPTVDTGVHGRSCVARLCQTGNTFERPHWLTRAGRSQPVIRPQQAYRYTGSPAAVVPVCHNGHSSYLTVRTNASPLLSAARRPSRGGEAAACRSSGTLSQHGIIASATS